MSDDECELDTLMSLLDDDNEDDGSDEKEDMKEVQTLTDEKTVHADVNTDTADEINSKKWTGKSTERQMEEDDDCDMETLAAFLDDEEDDMMDSDTENVKERNSDNENNEEHATFDRSIQEVKAEHHIVSNQEIKENNQGDVNADNSGCDFKVDSFSDSEVCNDRNEDHDEEVQREDQGLEDDEDDVSDIQAELLKMQQKMMALQEQLNRKTGQKKTKTKDISSSDSQHSKMIKGNSSNDKSMNARDICGSESQRNIHSSKGNKSVCHQKMSLQDNKDSDKNFANEMKKSKQPVAPINKSQLIMEKGRPVTESRQKNISIKQNVSSLQTSSPGCHIKRKEDSVPGQERKVGDEKTESLKDKLSRKTTEMSKKKSAPMTKKSPTESLGGSLILKDDGDKNPFFPDVQSEEKETATSLELFGDSDSDWEDLGGEEKPKLSETGQVLHNIIKKDQGQRVSNVSKDEVQLLRQKALKSQSWKARPFPGQEMVDPPHKERKSEDPHTVDPFSGIRIVNPKVSSTDMKIKMADRKLVKISRIPGKLNSADLQGDWVTIGVVVHKTEPRTSTSGKTFCIWKLSDLENCDITISFFLFGEVYKQHWKNEVKTVVGILNPNKMDKAEKNQGDVAFTVNHPNQILVMGYSKDLGKCAGASKAGKPCHNFINRQQGEFCVYHVQNAYRKTSSKRTELQGSCAVTPKNQLFGQKSKKDGFFFYQGETFTNTKRKANTDKVTLKKLQEKQAWCGKKKVTTMSLHQLDPEDVEKLKQLDQKKNELVELLTMPTVGSMNLVKHLVKKEKPTGQGAVEEKTQVIQSVTPAQLLKQHQLQMKQKKDMMSKTPSLGKGCSPNGFISFDLPSKPRSIVKKEIAKKRAISKVQKLGGIEKEDPNGLKRKRTSPEAKSKIEERVLTNLEINQTENSKNEEPPKKRSKLLGNLDENSEEFKKLMKSKSMHTGALAEVEREQEERYFMELEKKEKYEDKMQSTMSVKCTAFTCKQCEYTAFKPLETCKTEGHSLVKIQTMKRFFKCKNCGKRQQSLQKYPTEACRNCGEYKYERVAMHEEKKGPKLAHENLSLRGDEIAFVGAMNQKVYLDI